MKISHISLGVTDLARSEAFYRDVLELPAARENDSVVVRWPDFLLVLTERPPAGRSKFHFGFEVGAGSDVDSWAERLRERGAQIVAGPATNDGLRQLFFLDPDEYEVEIFSQH